MVKVLNDKKSDTKQHTGMYISKRRAAHHGKRICSGKIIFIEGKKAPE
jgi:hypothetical protein